MVNHARNFVKLVEMKAKIYEIKDDEIGHSYDTIFGPYIDANVTKINITEPYLSDVFMVGFDRY